MSEIFDEKRLGLEIEIEWGPYGVHAKLYWDILKSIAAKDAEISRLSSRVKDLEAVAEAAKKAEEAMYMPMPTPESQIGVMALRGRALHDLRHALAALPQPPEEKKP